MIIVAIAVAAAESVSPVLGCLRALVALTASVLVDKAQLPGSLSGAEPDRHGLRTPKRILRAAGTTDGGRPAVLLSESPTEALLTAKAEALYKWASVRLMPDLLARASAAAVGFCLDHLPSEPSMDDMRECEEVPAPLLHARARSPARNPLLL